MQPSANKVNTNGPHGSPVPVENIPGAPRPADHSLGLSSLNAVTPTPAENNSGTSALVWGSAATSGADEHSTTATRPVQAEHPRLSEWNCYVNQ